MDSYKIGKFILELRKEKKWSQRDLSEKIPISRQAVSKWENGITVPDSSTLIILSQLFKITVDELILGKRISKNDINLKKDILSLALKTSDENIKNKSKIKRLRVIFLFSIILCIIIFLTYYFFNTYNTIKVFTINGIGENYSTHDGIFVTTKKQIYFRLGSIEGYEKEAITQLELYYYSNNEKIHIFSSDTENILLKDYYGYEAYFDIDKLQVIKSNLYLKIKSQSTEEEIALEVKEDFTNNDLLFIDTNKIGKENTSSNAENDFNKKYERKMKCEKNICNLDINEKGKQISFIYFKDTKLINIKEEEKTKMLEWNYFIENRIVDYKKYENGEEVLTLTLLIDNVTADEKTYVDYFFDNYINKYL